MIQRESFIRCHLVFFSRARKIVYFKAKNTFEQTAMVLCFLLGYKFNLKVRYLKIAHFNPKNTFGSNNDGSAFFVQI